MAVKANHVAGSQQTPAGCSGSTPKTRLPEMRPEDIRRNVLGSHERLLCPPSQPTAPSPCPKGIGADRGFLHHFLEAQRTASCPPCPLQSPGRPQPQLVSPQLTKGHPGAPAPLINSPCPLRFAATPRQPRNRSNAARSGQGNAITPPRPGDPPQPGPLGCPHPAGHCRGCQGTTPQGPKGADPGGRQPPPKDTLAEPSRPAPLQLGALGNKSPQSASPKQL